MHTSLPLSLVLYLCKPISHAYTKVAEIELMGYLLVACLCHITKLPVSFTVSLLFGVNGQVA
jgi:hypothetical protein